MNSNYSRKISDFIFIFGLHIIDKRSFLAFNPCQYPRAVVFIEKISDEIS